MSLIGLVVVGLLLGSTRKTETNLAKFVTSKEFGRRGTSYVDLCLTGYVRINDVVEDITECGVLAKRQGFRFFASGSDLPCWASNDAAASGQCEELIGSSIYEIEPIDIRELYDKSRTPNDVVTVSVFATITKIGNLDTISQRYDYTAYFRQQWTDSRLSWHPPDFRNITEISYINPNIIWIPDSFFSTSISVASPDNEAFTVISSDGGVFYSRRIIVSASCDMNFLYYPFDTQTCYNDVESYGWTPERVQYTLPQHGSTFKAIDIDNNCDVCGDHRTVGSYYVENPSATLIQKQYGPRRFLGVRWKIQFVRQRATYLFTTFLPLWLICALSIGSCWIDSGSAPARVGMGITTVLVMINQMHSFRSDLPEVRYTTAMDAYFILCFMFVVLNVGEYGVINHFSSKLAVKEKQIRSKTNTLKTTIANSDRLYKPDNENNNDNNQQHARPNFATEFESPPTDVSVVNSAPRLSVDTPMESASSPSDGFSNVLTSHHNVLDGPHKEPLPSPVMPHTLKGSYYLPDYDTMNIAAQAYIKECFRTFDKDCSGTITPDELRLMLHYMGVDTDSQAYLLDQLRRQHPDGRVDLAAFTSLLATYRVLEVYGVRALVCCGYGITRSTLRDMETVYRWVTPTVFIVINIVWFIIVGING